MKKYLMLLVLILAMFYGSLVLVTAEDGVQGEAQGEAAKGVCSIAAGEGSKGEVFNSVCSAAKVDEEGVKNITYDQFIQIRTSGEEHVLVDVLGVDSYKSGHIPGAISFPLYIINEFTSSKMLDKDSNIIVYCGSFKCMASTKAAKTLQDLGYKVVDYKGGLKEWQEKGHILREA